MSSQEIIPQRQKAKTPKLLWKRIVIGLIALLCFIIATIAWILSIGHIISGDWSVILPTVFTFLTVVFTLFMWLFPFSPIDMRGQPGISLTQPTQLSLTSASSPPSSAEKPQSAWNVPYHRNPFFTGREVILSQLLDYLTKKATALSRPQAISGLGGVGKTQIAVEYAYRYRDAYRYVLWANAATRETLIADYTMLASRLHLPQQNEPDQGKLAAAVMRWLSEHSDWLLILDNADDLDMTCSFLPSNYEGHVLMTTRESATGGLAQGIEVREMDREEGTLMLLRRAKLIGPETALDAANSQVQEGARAIVVEMGGLPLALDQAGAYIEESKCTLADYLAAYRRRQADLLQQRGRHSSDHANPVAATWSLNFEEVERNQPMAADLLRCCAFLSPDDIPEELLIQSARELGPRLRSLMKEPSLLDEVVGALRRYSLIWRDPEHHTLSIHRLVQAMLKGAMREKEQRRWAKRIIRTVNRGFPAVEPASWSICQRYLPHAISCITLIDHWHFESAEAIRLLNQVGLYLKARAQYMDAEPILQRAIAIGEKKFGPLNHLTLAGILSNLAELYTAQGKYADAEVLYQRAFAIGEKILGPEHPVLIGMLNGLANVYSAQCQFAEAEALYQRTIAIGEKAFGSEYPVLATMLNNQAALYQLLKKFTEAEPLLQRAITIGEKALGSEHPALASRLCNLALLYIDQGKYAEAEPLMRRATTISEKALGSEHPALAGILSDLAELYIAQGKYTEAEPLLQHAITIGEKALCPDHPYLARWLNNLAILYREQSKYTEAEPLLQRAMVIGEKWFGPDHPKTVSFRESYLNLRESMEKRQDKAAEE